MAWDEIKIRKAKPLLAEDMKIGEVSKMLGFSYVREFSKTFKSISGMTPSEYKNSCPDILKRRADERRHYETIRGAKKLLSKDIKVGHVASDLGFPCDSAFIDYFKEHTGETPGDYQNSHSRVIAKRRARINETIRTAKVLLAQDMKVYDVASQLDFSAKYFADFFKEQTGESPVKYTNSHYSVIVKRRTEKNLSRGLNLLRKGWRYQTISKKLGYTRPEGFYKLVQRHTNMTPLEYQSKYLDRTA
jgi:AraC-like DNA-binding protein